MRSGCGIVSGLFVLGWRVFDMSVRHMQSAHCMHAIALVTA